MAEVLGLMEPLRHHFRQMTTDIVGIIYADPSQRLAGEAAFVDVERLFARVEQQLSRFRGDSELGALNRAAGSWFKASPLLLRIIDLALVYAGQTDGLFDPTILRALEAAGYDRSFDEIGEAASARAAPPVTFRDVKIDVDRQLVWLPPEAGIDLGGIAKGWAVDQGMLNLRRFGDAALSAGGDLFCAGAPPGLSYWQIGVEDPFEPSQDLLQIYVRDAAVATSGLRRRRWIQRGESRHHVIDPRTGQPAQTDLMAVTILARSTTEADVLAKAAFVLGSERGRAFLEARGDCAGVFVRADRTIESTNQLADAGFHFTGVDARNQSHWRGNRMLPSP